VVNPVTLVSGMARLHGTGITTLTVTAGTLNLNGNITASGAVTNAGTIFGLTWAIVCNSTLTSSGTINNGAGGLRVIGNTSFSGGTLNGYVGADPTIEFDGDAGLGGNVTLGVFIHNDDTIVFAGSATPAAQTFNSNGQRVGNVTINNALGVQLLTSSVIQAPAVTGSSYTLTIQAGELNLGALGWVADSNALATAMANTYSGVVGTLRLGGGAGAGLRCGIFTATAVYSIDNPGANTITASGDVTIAGTFSTPANSTLVMSGTGLLNATPQIGSLTASGSVTLDNPLSMNGSMTISGSLDVSASSHQITLTGDWNNSNTFNSRTGTVKFNGSSVHVYGNNTWCVFDCEVPGAYIFFEENHTQAIKSSGYFRIIGTSILPITISRQNLLPAPPSNPLDPYQSTALGWALGTFPNAAIMWQLDLNAGALLDMANAIVKYSDARAHPVAVPDTVAIYAVPGTPPSGFTYMTCYQWITGLPLVYAYTEDSDGNGKIDRIRAVSAAVLNGNFSGFTATVDGYTVDTSKGTNGYAMVPIGSTLPHAPIIYGGDGYEFFIYLVEKGYNDTGAKPMLSVKNTSLLDESTKKFRLNTLNSVAMTCIDSAPPKIAYTLALPNQSQVFFHFSEPVFATAAGAVVLAADFGAASVIRVAASGNGTSEALVVHVPPVISAAAILGESLAYPLASTLYDAPQAIIDYSAIASWLTFFNDTYSVTPPTPYNINNSSGGAAAWPTPISSLTHRVSDLLIDVPISTASDPTYFMWPIYAKDRVKLSLSDAEIEAMTASETAAEGIGLIRAFDGTQWLRDQDITVQARLQPSLSSVTGVYLHFDSNVGAALVSSTGLWLPSFAETGFSGLAPFPNAPPWGRGASISVGAKVATNLYNFAIPSSDPRIVSVSTVGFYFSFIPAPGGQPLYAARLDMAAGGAIPSNWYQRLKPFSFIVHDVTRQRGGVTILNNVIDPTKNETVRLSYQQKTGGAVTVTVFTLDGDVVARLVNSSKQEEGDHAVSWNGRNLGGSPVARGLYFIRIVAPGMDEIRKVIVVRK
jgi:fibronectin-binding autotransporter adhesin